MGKGRNKKQASPAAVVVVVDKKGSGNSKAHDVIRNTITELSTYHQ
jgi:hypothetical protein